VPELKPVTVTLGVPVLLKIQYQPVEPICVPEPKVVLAVYVVELTGAAAPVLAAAIKMALFAPVPFVQEIVGIVVVVGVPEVIEVAWAVPVILKSSITHLSLPFPLLDKLILTFKVVVAGKFVIDKVLYPSVVRLPPVEGANVPGVEYTADADPEALYAQ
jgi:hypothetical protein